MMKALGLAELGPAAYRMTLDGTTLRSGFFLSAPQPRQGLLALMDQTPIAPVPADWVSGDVVGYQHISFDLGKAYKQVAQIVRDNSHKGGESIAQIEAQTQQFLQVDVGALLSSLGTKHVILSFPPVAPNKVVKAAEEEIAQNAMALVCAWPMNRSGSASWGRRRSWPGSRSRRSKVSAVCVTTRRNFTAAGSSATATWCWRSAKG